MSFTPLLWLRSVGRWAFNNKIPAGVLIVGLVLLVVYVSKDEVVSEETTEEVLPTVVLIPLSGEGAGGSLTVVGEVRSQAESNLFAERTGELIQVNVTSGQTVTAGRVLAQLENATEAAAVAQARASVATQEAQLNQLLNGTRTEDLNVSRSQFTQAESGVREAKTKALNAYREAYASSLDSIRSKSDNFFRDPENTNVNLLPISATLAESNALEAERVALNGVLASWNQSANSLSAQTIGVTELDQADDMLRRVQSFVNELSRIVSKQEVSSYVSQSQINADEAIMSSARTQVSGALTSVSVARSGLESAVTQLAVAREQLTAAEAGPRTESIDAARAQVASVQASLQSALAQLEKTLIRTPISGTVSTLSVSRGDFVNAGQLVAVVSNPNALQIEAFVSSAAQQRTAVGSEVTLADGRAQGVVSSVDPGLDPVTKKARVLIGVTEGSERLVQGESVTVSIASTLQKDAPQAAQAISVPLTALKIRPDSTSLFTVEDGVLVAHPVTTGAVIGDVIQVTTELDPATMIVRDVRGLNAGDAVAAGEAETVLIP